jgi:hypothetical protein
VKRHCCVLPIVRCHPLSNWDPYLGWTDGFIRWGSPLTVDNGLVVVHVVVVVVATMAIRTISKNNKWTCVSFVVVSVACKISRHCCPGSDRTTDQKGRTTATTRPCAASRRYQVEAKEEHQHKSLLRFIQSNEEKSRLCLDGPLRDETRRLWPRR